MKNELFRKLLAHEGAKDVPLIYLIKVFSAVQEILAEEKAEMEMMDRG